MVRILTFIWNTESVRLSDSMASTETYLPAESPDFFPDLVEKIQVSNPDLVVIAFQECCYPGSYFHSHFLQAEMPKVGYTFVKRTKMIGAGQTTYKAIFSLDLKLRGLRLSIYAKHELMAQIHEGEESLKLDGLDQAERVCSPITRNKGGTASYLRIPSLGTFAFINVHLPFDSTSLLDSTLTADPMIRKNGVLQQNIAFNDIYRHLVLDLTIKPDYVIYMGDFNYRISPKPLDGCVTDTSGTSPHSGTNSCPSGPRVLSAFEIAEVLERRPSVEIFQQLYLNYDELREQMMLANIYPFFEGVNNTGPLFLPTGKLMKERPEGYDHPSDEDPQSSWHSDLSRLAPTFFKTGIAHQRCPSWCDRILYTSLDTTKVALQCLSYERFDVGQTMKKSDHAGVIGVFEIVRSE